VPTLLIVALACLSLGACTAYDDAILDTDLDGIADKIDGSDDVDNDGSPNSNDEDSDGDAISDALETTLDYDGDGTGNWVDTDSDADGVPDWDEGSADLDGDGALNFIDTDADGDGGLDGEDKDTYCIDSRHNASETDVDCGGPCNACLSGLRCKQHTDCVSRVCGSKQVCATASCTDKTNNGAEFSADCGGDCGQCTATQLSFPAQSTVYPERGRSVAVFNDRVLIGSHDSSSTSSVHVFERNGTGFRWLADLKPSDPALGFGYALALNESFLVVGAPDQPASTGARGVAHVFARQSDGKFRECTKLEAKGTTSDYFGSEVAIRGDRIVVAARGEKFGTTFAGSAFVYKHAGACKWLYESTLTPVDGRSNDWFGNALAMGEDFIAVSSKHGGSATQLYMTGGVYIFTRDNTSWKQCTYLVGRDTKSGDIIGASLAFQKPNLYVGAPGRDERGAAFAGGVNVFEYLGQCKWREHSAVHPTVARYTEQFGSSVAVTKNALVVGAFGALSTMDSADRAGAVYTFQLSDLNARRYQALLLPSQRHTAGQFGASLATHGTTIVVGAPGSQATYENVRGEAHVFEIREALP